MVLELIFWSWLVEGWLGDSIVTEDAKCKVVGIQVRFLMVGGASEVRIGDW